MRPKRCAVRVLLDVVGSQVVGYVYGPLAITPAIGSDRRGGGRWMVTHIHSGYGLCAPFKTKRAAERAMRTVLGMADWTFTSPSHVKRWTKSKRQSIKRALAKVRR